MSKREAESVHPDANRYGGWHWSRPRHGEHFRRCSYCGSVHPEDLAAEALWTAEWADQKYGWPHKFYVNVINRDPSRLYVLGSSSGQSYRNDPDKQPAPVLKSDTHEWVRWSELTPAQLAIVAEDNGADYHADWIEFGYRPTHFGKLYTVHLGDPALPADVKDLIERRSGLAFTFYEDGRVGWHPAPPYVVTPTPANTVVSTQTGAPNTVTFNPPLQ